MPYDHVFINAVEKQQRQTAAQLKGQVSTRSHVDPRGAGAEGLTPPSRPKLSPEPNPRPAPSAVERDTQLSRPQQRLLDALARLEAARVVTPTRTQVAALAGVSPKSSGFEKNVSTLSSAELITYPAPGRLQLTYEGCGKAAEVDAPPSVEEFQDYIYRLISGPQATLLRVLVGLYPKAVTRGYLASACNVSPASSGFEKNVSTLSSFGFVHYPERGYVAATPLLFLEDR